MGQPFQVHIQQLLQAGIATHFVQNDASVDPIFALSKVRDFPEVTFAATFDDGTVVLGCPDKLPDPLVGLAQPIAPAQATPPNNIEAKLDALMAHLETDETDTAIAGKIGDLSNAFGQQQTMIAALQGQITDVQASVEKTQNDIAAKPVENLSLDALQGQIARLAESARPAPETDGIMQQLLQMQTDIAQVLTLTEAQTSAPSSAPNDTTITNLEDRLSTQIAMVPTAHDLSKQTQQIAETKQMMEQSLSTLSNDVKALIVMHGAEASQTATQAQLAELVTTLENLPGLIAVDEKLGTISAELRAMSDTQTQPPDPVHDQLSTQINTLAADVAAMSQRPPPTVDIIEHRQGFARFQTAMAAVIARLEQTVMQVSTMGEARQTADTQDLHHKIDMLSQSIAPVSDLPAQLTDLADELRPIPLQGDRILSQLSTLNVRPDPAPIDAAQRRSVAQFVNAMGVIVSRFETAVDGVGKQAQQTDLAPILGQIETSLATVIEQQSQTDLMANITAQRIDLDALRSDLATFNDRPLPTLDLTAQRTSFAQFGTAMKSILTRFEKIASQIEHPAAQQTHENKTEATETVEQTTGMSFSDSQISLRTLREDFAELIAKQIMDNTLGTSPQSREALR